MTETDETAPLAPLDQAIEALSLALCPFNHPERWKDPETAYVCEDCQTIAAQACTSDWLTLITAFREDRARAQGVAIAAQEATRPRKLTDPPEPFQRVKAHLEELAEHYKPIEPDPADPKTVLESAKPTKGPKA